MYIWTPLKLISDICFISKGAIDRFTPEDRDCYTAEEVNLVSLPLKKGYREENSSEDLTS